jgi:hypothetical protein
LNPELLLKIKHVNVVCPGVIIATTNDHKLRSLSGASASTRRYVGANSMRSVVAASRGLNAFCMQSLPNRIDWIKHKTVIVQCVNITSIGASTKQHNLLMHSNCRVAPSRKRTIAFGFDWNPRCFFAG